MSVMTRISRAILAAAILAGSGLATAQQADALEIRTIVQKELVTVDADGNESRELIAADSVVPGDTVVYTITFTNIGDEDADNIVVTNPIAAELAYVDGSAFGANTTIEFSVDGGATWGASDSLTVVDGGVERAATGSDFTHIRWVVNGTLPAGRQGTARFAAVLE